MGSRSHDSLLGPNLATLELAPRLRGRSGEVFGSVQFWKNQIFNSSFQLAEAPKTPKGPHLVPNPTHFSPTMLRAALLSFIATGGAPALVPDR